MVSGHTRTEDTLYSYDVFGRLQTVTATVVGGVDRSADPLVATYRYTAAGNLQQEVMATSASTVTTTFSYDPFGRVLREAITKTPSATPQAQGLQSLGTPLETFVYTVRPDSNRTSETDLLYAADGTVSHVQQFTWTYDAEDRLTGETLASTVCSTSNDYADAYTYDLQGNRVEMDHATAAGTETTRSTYNFHDELLQTIDDVSGITTYTYDLNGSQLTSETIEHDGSITMHTIFGYDLQNRLTTADTDGEGPIHVTYQYDGNRHRVSVTTSNGTTYYLQDDNNPSGYNQVIEETAALGGTAPSAGYMVAFQVIAQQTAMGLTVLLRDAHGSVRLVVSVSNGLTQSLSYSAYGEALGFDPATTPTLYQYNGMRIMVGLPSMDDFNFRAYEPRTSRFPQRDSADVLNLYAYASSNPINRIDPTGHDSYPYTSTNGIAAHVLFAAYSVAAGLAQMPDTPLGILLPGLFPSSSPAALLTPDAVNTATKNYYDLKPVTHYNSTVLQIEDSEQMLLYDAALIPHGYTRGDSSKAISNPSGMPIGEIVGDHGENLEVILYPQRNPMMPSSLNGKGLILYALEEVDEGPRGRLIPVTVPVPAPSKRPYQLRKRDVDTPRLPVGVLAGVAIAALTISVAAIAAPAISSVAIETAQLLANIAIRVLLDTLLAGA